MNIIVLDIETTNFLNKGGKIVEVGAVSLDLDTGYTEAIFDSLMREPGLTQSDRESWIFKNSTLTVEDVREASASELVLQQLQAVIDQYPDGVTAFNRDFDIGFLSSRGIRFPKLQPCPMKVATDVCKVPAAYGGFKWPKVEECYSIFFPEYEYKEAHRGLSDAIDEAVLVYYLYKQGYYKPI